MLKRNLLLGASLLALAVGLAACGGSSSSSSSEPTSTGAEQGAAAGGAGNIVAVAKETPELSILVEALAAAGLVKTLEEPGPYTVFAPTNEAFEALGGTLNKLLEPANKAELAEILTYHVVPGKVESSELSNGQQLKTVQGGSLEVKVAGGMVTVNGAEVVQPDVEASNGVVHVIDEVLIPPKQG